ncbi:hypothetical protein BDQ17DRAFT_1507165, partial [Cyathus striatus]
GLLLPIIYLWLYLFILRGYRTSNFLCLAGRKRKDMRMDKCRQVCIHICTGRLIRVMSKYDAINAPLNLSRFSSIKGQSLYQPFRQKHVGYTRIDIRWGGPDAPSSDPGKMLTDSEQLLLRLMKNQAGRDVVGCVTDPKGGTDGEGGWGRWTDAGKTAA